MGWRRRFELAALGAIALIASALSPVEADVLEPYQSSGQMRVYLGVIPEQIVRGHAAAHPEATMHGNIKPPSARTTNVHLVVAIFDVDGNRISDAQVSASLATIGHLDRQEVKLEPMQIAGTVTFGGFVPISKSEKETILIHIVRPGTKAPEDVRFTYLPSNLP